MLAKLSGYVCVLIALILVAIVAYRTTLPAPAPLLFSPTELLAATWRAYKHTYVDATFRTVDKQRGVTTSEGQSYTMLRSVWAGDQATFDGSWGWTRGNLARKDDHLFAWLWGARESGGQGILSSTTASDADSDIALALVFAYARWQDPSYLAAARAVITDIWKQEVVQIAGIPYLAADSLEKSSKTPYIVVNPSYLSPASYHIFAQVDPAHDWEGLRSASYRLIGASIAAPLDTSTAGQLPPDWVFVSKADGSLLPPAGATFDTNFGYDALRIPWRIALDYEWFKNPDALAALQAMPALGREWQSKGKVAAIHGHDGRVVDGSEAAALYGGAIGYFSLADPALAPAVYGNKLVSLYSPSNGTWATTLSYYDDNWVWFGIALYNNLLPNLSSALPTRAFSE